MKTLAKCYGERAAPSGFIGGSLTLWILLPATCKQGKNIHFLSISGNFLK